MVNKKPTFISLFAGCGGSSLGYQWASFQELLAVEWDDNAVETFKLNFLDIPIWKRDIRKVTGKEILDFCKIKKGELDLLDASPPCQGFSTAGKRKVLDSRNDLFLEFVRLIKELEPKVFVMENVSGLIKGKMKGIFIEIMKELKALPYRVKCKLMNAAYYEVPQSRQRLIWIGIKKELGKEPIFPEVHKKIVSIKEAIEDLEGVNLGRKNGHIMMNLGDVVIKKMAAIPEGKDITSCPKSLKGGAYFNSYMRRTERNKPSPTLLKENGSLRIHYEFNRYLTPREMARASSFPDRFSLRGTFANMVYVIANSVPPKFMQAIAETIKETAFDIN